MIQFTISQLTKDVEDGLTRKEIAKKYNVSANVIKDVFNHPKLKGIRAKAKKEYELIDDTTGEVITDKATNMPEVPTPPSRITPESQDLNDDLSTQF